MQTPFHTTSNDYIVKICFDHPDSFGQWLITKLSGFEYSHVRLMMYPVKPIAPRTDVIELTRDGFYKKSLPTAPYMLVFPENCNKIELNMRVECYTAKVIDYRSRNLITMGLRWTNLMVLSYLLHGSFPCLNCASVIGWLLYNTSEYDTPKKLFDKIYTDDRMFNVSSERLGDA